MDVAATIAWIHTTWLHQEMVKVPLLFSICETLHFIGLCLLLGALMIVDLRLIGLMRVMPIGVALRYVWIAALGFLINLSTGICFIAFNPEGYWTNWMFRLKMILVILAGINAVWFTLMEHRKVSRLTGDAPVPPSVKTMATLSLALWIAVLIAGRLLPVTQTLGTG